MSEYYNYQQNKETNPSFGNDHLEKLDQLLDHEEKQTGKKVFKRGLALRHGLIDVKGVLDVINQQRAQISQATSNSDAVSLPTKTKRNKSSEKTAWKQALKAMSKNPALLLEAVPSSWENPPLKSQLNTDYSQSGDITRKQ